MWGFPSDPEPCVLVTLKPACYLPCNLGCNR